MSRSVLCSVLFAPPLEGASAGRDGSAALEVPFIYEPERGAIVLELTADRRTAHVLLDTGAARTVLSADVYKRRIDGLLGQDILTRFQSVEIDFRTRRLRLVGSRPDGLVTSRP